MGFTSTYHKQLIEVFRLRLRLKDAGENRLTTNIFNVSENIANSWNRKCSNIINNLEITNIMNSRRSTKNKLRTMDKRDVRPT